MPLAMTHGIIIIQTPSSMPTSTRSATSKRPPRIKLPDAALTGFSTARYFKCVSIKWMIAICSASLWAVGVAAMAWRSRTLKHERVRQPDNNRSFFKIHYIADLHAHRADEPDPHSTNSPNHPVERRLLLHGSRPLGPADYLFSCVDLGSPVDHRSAVHEKCEAHVIRWRRRSCQNHHESWVSEITIFTVDKGHVFVSGCLQNTRITRLLLPGTQTSLKRAMQEQKLSKTRDERGLTPL